MKEKENRHKPMHKQIEEDLLEKITSGFYKENELIPKEVELAEYYQVSRPTVRHAIQSLVNEGYLERKKRKGTIVRKRKIDQEFTHIIESYDSEMSRKGLLPKTRVLTFKKDTASEEIAENLGVQTGDEVYKLVRLRYAGEDPVVLVTTYLPQYLLPDFLKHDFSKQRLYGVLAERGLQVNAVKRKLDVIKADETTSDLLDIVINDPIFYFHTIGYTGDRIPIEYSISKYRGDLNSFVFEVNNVKNIGMGF
ncbi:GntR family transcriptional regulator [Weizmannia sp. FSL W8-0401]|uniref:GntR family transcriptional regulator n=1 Tax=Weizmannia sp. FSL W8-0401 TaxID=2954554 RepID=UPI0030F8E2E1